MPNIDEHFESLLPLVPGVVRGPNGLINMKGARSSQNGSLVNSADVTDPATEAINIPIDVVSSVQVLSTPFDPEYGKFTGAVSSVETRPGDFDKNVRPEPASAFAPTRRLRYGHRCIHATDDDYVFLVDIVNRLIDLSRSRRT
jgi:hypothetical protein